MNLELLKFLFDKRCNYFERYLKVIESTLFEYESDLRKTSLEVNDEEEHLKREEYLIAEADDLEEIRQLMFSSFVISIFASMEEVLAILCKNVQSKYSEIFSYDDLEGSGLDRVLKYLKKIFQNNFPHEERLYDNLKVSQNVRNLIVHNGAKIKPAPKSGEVRSFIKKHQNLLNLDNDQILFTLEYAKSLIKLHRDICAEILAKY